METSNQAPGERLASLKKERDAYVHRLFYMMLEFLFIFGVPAFIALYFGKRLDAGDGKTWQVSLLALSFVLSWTMAIAKIRRAMKTMSTYDEEIKELETHVE